MKTYSNAKISKLTLIVAVAFIIITVNLLTACSGESTKLKVMPTPAEIYAKISVLLPEMAPLSADEIEMQYGIEEFEYSSAVAYSNLDMLKPDEIVVVQAISETEAEAIREKLETHVTAAEQSAQDYLPENVPVIRDAVVRRDGLTVSLLVSENIDEIVKAYDGF